MAQKTLTVREIEVQVAGLFTTNHTFLTQTGTLGKLTLPAFNQYGEFDTIGGRKLLMQKTHWLGSAHELVEGDTVRGTADRAGLFRSDYIVQFDGRQYRLEPEGAFKQGWYLVDAQGTPLLEIQPRGAFKQGAYLIIWGAIDADLVAFAYYLYHMRVQEQAAAIAATSAS
jgi:hypothetical protein